MLANQIYFTSVHFLANTRNLFYYNNPKYLNIIIIGNFCVLIFLD